MRIGTLTHLAFFLNSAIDTGKYPNLNLDEVGREIDRGTVFNFLAERLKGDIDLSLFDAKKKSELIAEWQDMRNAIDTRRKFGVERNGLCILLAYCLEGIQ